MDPDYQPWFKRQLIFQHFSFFVYVYSWLHFCPFTIPLFMPGTAPFFHILLVNTSNRVNNRDLVCRQQSQPEGQFTPEHSQSALHL